MNLASVSCAFAIVCWACGAQAQDTTRRDVRCLAVTAAAAGTVKDPEMVTLAASASLYFLGRLEGRTPDVDWLGRAVDEFDLMSSDEAEASIRACGELMQQKGEELEARGAELTNRSPPREKSPG